MEKAIKLSIASEKIFSSLASEKISALIIDHDYDSMEVFSELLGLLKISTVKKSTDVKKAGKDYLKLKPSICFIDIEISQSGGINAINLIHNVDPEAKIVAITTDANDEAIDLLDKDILSGILVKPYSITSLRCLIEDELCIKIPNGT